VFASRVVDGDEVVIGVAQSLRSSSVSLRRWSRQVGEL